MTLNSQSSLKPELLAHGDHLHFSLIILVMFNIIIVYHCDSI